MLYNCCFVFLPSQLGRTCLQVVELGGSRVLLVAVDDDVYAVSNKCSHLGLPIVGESPCLIVQSPVHMLTRSLTVVNASFGCNGSSLLQSLSIRGDKLCFSGWGTGRALARHTVGAQEQ
jgi:hypothetical protein